MIKKIDGQIKILKSQRTAESIVSPGKDINTAFDELESDVKDLDVELEVQMAASNEKLDARLYNSSTANLVPAMTHSSIKTTLLRQHCQTSKKLSKVSSRQRLAKFADMFSCTGRSIFIRDTRLVPGVPYFFIVAMSNNNAKSPLILFFIAVVGGTFMFLVLAGASYYFYSTAKPVSDTQEPGFFHANRS